MTDWVWVFVAPELIVAVVWIQVRTFGHALRVLREVNPWTRLALMTLIVLVPCIGPLIYHLILMEWGEEYGIYQ